MRVSRHQQSGIFNRGKSVGHLCKLVYSDGYIGMGMILREESMLQGKMVILYT